MTLGENSLREVTDWNKQKRRATGKVVRSSGDSSQTERLANCSHGPNYLETTSVYSRRQKDLSLAVKVSTMSGDFPSTPCSLQIVFFSGDGRNGSNKS